MTRTRTILALSTVLALLVGLVVYAAFATRDTGGDFSKPKPASSSAPAGLDAFYGQDLTFSGCGSAQCTTVKVPVDYDKPDGATTELKVTVFPASGGESKSSLFVNPGGPGGSAVDFAATMAKSFGADVRKKYNVVGVDPRGVGESSPLTCLSAKKFDAFSATDPEPDDPAEVTALRQSIEDLGAACRDNSGELAAHVSTVEVAKDMDVVRALLGQSKLDWFGASYGTEIGAVYAELFPGKVGRMVLDGAVDPAQDAVEASFAQTTGFQRALVAYVKDCVKSSSCPLGNDVDAGLAKVEQLMEQIDAKPLPGDDDRQLTEGLAFYGIAVTLYDKETWQYLTQALNAAFKGDGSILLLLSDAYFERQPNGSYSTNGGQVIYAVNCLDSPDGLTVAQTEAILPRFKKASPVFGPALAWGALGCSDWPIKATNPLPTIDGKGAPPIVVVGTTRDPATPYESAEALASQLDSGVLLTRDGDGHTAYLSGNKCIAQAVDAYLVDGLVPAKGKTC